MRTQQLPRLHAPPEWPLYLSLCEWLDRDTGVSQERAEYRQFEVFVTPSESPELSSFADWVKQAVSDEWIQVDCGIDSEGHLLVVSEYGRRFSFSPEDVFRALRLGYYPPRISHILVRELPSGGLGGFGVDLAEFLLELGLSAALSKVVAKSLHAAKNLRSTRNPSQQERWAASWRESSGLEMPEELRLLIDRMPAHDRSNLGSRLRIPDATADFLLTSLGYVHDPFSSSWVLGRDGESRHRRELWLQKEMPWG